MVEGIKVRHGDMERQGNSGLKGSVNASKVLRGRDNDGDISDRPTEVACCLSFSAFKATVNNDVFSQLTLIPKYFQPVIGGNKQPKSGLW